MVLTEYPIKSMMRKELVITITLCPETGPGDKQYAV